MKEITISLKHKMLSINNAYTPKLGKSRRTGKTFVNPRGKKDSTSDWQAEMGWKILSKRRDIQKFSEAFRDNEHCLEVEYIFFLPRNKIITKKGNIVKMKNDLCNALKLPNDVLSKLLDIDDAQITDLPSRKRVSPDHEYYMFIRVQRLDISEIEAESKELWCLL